MESKALLLQGHDKTMCSGKFLVSMHVDDPNVQCLYDARNSDAHYKRFDTLYALYPRMDGDIWPLKHIAESLQYTYMSGHVTVISILDNDDMLDILPETLHPCIDDWDKSIRTTVVQSMLIYEYSQYDDLVILLVGDTMIAVYNYA